MPSNAKLPYSFCKRYGVIATSSLNSGELSLATRSGASLNAIAEAQRLLGMVNRVSVESEGEFNRLLSRHFENDRETSFTEVEKIGGELNLDEVARELSEPEDLLEITPIARPNLLVGKLECSVVAAGNMGDEVQARLSGAADRRVERLQTKDPVAGLDLRHDALEARQGVFDALDATPLSDSWLAPSLPSTIALL